jgi:hypothetical protein
MTPLRRRMIEDMRLKNLGRKLGRDGNWDAARDGNWTETGTQLVFTAQTN